MATSPRCLCLVLTIRIAVLRSSAAVRTGSPDSVWWGTKESAPLLDSIRQQITPGNFAAGEALFDKCLGEELRHACRDAGRTIGLSPSNSYPTFESAADCPEGLWAPEPNPFRDTSSKLPTEERRLLQAGGRKNPVSDRSGLRLTEMEAQAGTGFSLNPVENFPSGDSLIHFQHGLKVSEVLLRVDLGAAGEFPIAVQTGRTNTEVESGRVL